MPISLSQLSQNQYIEIIIPVVKEQLVSDSHHNFVLIWNIFYETSLSEHAQFHNAHLQLTGAEGSQGVYI